MPLTPPKFWYEPHGSYLGVVFEPFSWLYRGGSALHRIFSKPCRTSVPVISVGNFVLGGAGKTPVTKAIAQRLHAMGRVPHIVSRGYKGTLKGPVQVDPARHQFDQVGDEPLLLAKTAPTWVSKDRGAAVHPAVSAGADILILDDGGQNYSLEKDISFMVVNAAQGFGNGRVFPAGPLRQSVQSGLKGTTAIIFIGEYGDTLPEPLSSASCPLIRATIVPLAPHPCPVVAFAGIGYPEKFHQTLIAAGYEIKAFVAFPDHYPYTGEDLRNLRMKAQEERACLITTEKDALRIPSADGQDILVLPIGLKFEPDAVLDSLLGYVLKR